MMTKNQVSYDAIGTAASPATLTAAYAGNTKTLFCGGFPNIHLDFKYLPNENNSYASVKIEVSNDDGVTFYQLASIQPGTSVIDTYMTPVKVPSSATVDNTLVSEYFDTTTVASHIKISALETTSGAFGTLHVRATFAE